MTLNSSLIALLWGPKECFSPCDRNVLTKRTDIKLKLIVSSFELLSHEHVMDESEHRIALDCMGVRMFSTVVETSLPHNPGLGRDI